MAGLARKLKFVFSLIVIAGGLAAADQAQAVVRIMPLGDSITASMDGQASYRYWLYKKLVTAGARVDFVGSQFGVSYGKPRYSDFDQNHEGHTGWSSYQVIPYVTRWTQTFRPDIVLLDLGANDVVQGKPASNTIMQLRLIIILLRAANPNVKVLVAKLSPMAGYEDQVAELNSKIGPLAAQMTRPNSSVMAVDLASGYDLATHSGDGVHPNEAGEKLIANRFYRLILPMLVILRQPASHPAASVQY